MLQKLDNWVFNTLIKLNKRIEASLEKREVKFYQKYIDREVDRLNLDERLAKNVKQLCTNTLTGYRANSQAMSGLVSLRGISLHTLIDLTIKVARGLYASLDNIVSVQTMNNVVSNVFFMEYKNEPGSISAELKSTVVQADSSQYKIQSPDNLRDNMDAYEGMISMFSNEILHDIIRSTIIDLSALADQNVSEVDFSASTDIKEFVSSIVTSIENNLNEMTNEFRGATRKYIIASPMIISLLMSTGKLKPNIDGAFSISTLIHAGTLSNDIDVYSALVSCETTAMIPGTDYIICGLKGKVATVTGHIVAPYNLSAASGTTINPVTFAATTNIGSRVGKHSNNPKMFRKINITNISFE